MTRPRLGLLGRTVVALAAAALVPLGVIPYLVELNRAGVSEQVLRTHAVAARTTASRVQAFLDALQQAVGTVAFNPEMYAQPRSPAGQDLLAGLLQAQPLIVGAVVENAEGAEVLRVRSRTHAEVVEAVLAAPSQRALLPRRELGSLWLRLTTPLPDSVGRLRVVARADPLEEILDVEELGREAVLAVASEADGVILSSEPSVGFDSFPESMVAAARSGRVSGASRFEDQDEGAVLGAYAPLAGAGWFVMSRQPARVAEAVAEQMQRQALIAVGIALALTAALSALAYRSLVRPMREAVQAQRKLARGGVGRPVGSELEQLRAGIAALERQTLDREAIGKVFLGRYLVMEIVGSGGMGTVFKGWDPKLERPVALKTVHLEAAKTASTASGQQPSLLREAVTLARINHPNIVAVYDIEDTGQVAFIAMEFVDGVNLQKLLAHLGSLGPEQAVPLAAAVARGLAAAHSHGVVHRDVKPGNVLLGRDGTIKLTDLGIAGHVTSMVEDAALVFGTPGYMPPEALGGERHDAAGDLFSLGVVLYECLAGSSPFLGSTPQESILRTKAAAVAPLRVKLPAIPRELDSLVLGLLQRRPEHRLPATAGEAAARLETLASENGWQWRYPERLEQMRLEEVWDAATHALAVPRTPRHDADA